MMNPLRVIGYCAWIGREIISGSMDIIGGIFSPGEYGKPMIVELPLRCETDLEVTLMSSSITITPGTLVVAAGPGAVDRFDEDGTRLEKGGPPTLFVHALFGESEEDVLEGLVDMEDRLLRMTRSGTNARRGAGAGGAGAEAGATGAGGTGAGGTATGAGAGGTEATS